MTDSLQTAMRVATFAASLALCALSFAADNPAPGKDKPAVKPPAAKSSLDAELLQSLDNALLEDVGGLAPADSSPDKSDLPADSASGASASIDGEDVTPADARSPLESVQRNMRRVEARLASNKAGHDLETITLQKQIVRDLSLLIAQLDEPQQQGGQGDESKSKPNDSQPNPGKNQSKAASGKQSAGGPPGKTGSAAAESPARESTDRVGKSRQSAVDKSQMRRAIKEAWGNLPRHEREQLLQASSEEFLPKYQELIERYYRRLAEEKQP